MGRLSFFAACALALATPAFSKEYFEERFSEDWETRWVKSSWKQEEGTAGDFTLTAGKWYGDAEEDKGIQTGPDARFFATTAEFKDAFDNKDKDLVLQFSVKHEQKLDCGGGYIKLLPASTVAEDFSGDSPYSIMFGPDMCGSTKRIHVIFNYKGANHVQKKTIPCETDQLTHVYTLHLKPDNSYTVMVDGEEKHAGSLFEDFDMLPPKEIKDPDDVKPDDWADDKMIVDETDVKPKDYDDIPAEIPDPDASKPDDWDDEDDGEWESRLVPNPDFKGPWVQKKIENPDYKGPWEASLIPNPEYKHDDLLYHYPDSKKVGFELWQVKAGSIFDNILVSDSIDYAKKMIVETYQKYKAGEKEMFDAEQEAKKAEEENIKQADKAMKEAEEEVKKFQDQLKEVEEEDDDDEEYDEDASHDEL